MNVHQNKPIAVLILQRNLPAASDSLVECLREKNDELCDFFVIESGSDDDKLSKYAAFHADWQEARKQGLHCCRGMNYGMSQLHQVRGRYPFYFMLMGDAKFTEGTDLRPFLSLMQEHRELGILSPRSRQWAGDVPDWELCYHYLIPHVAWLFRDEFVQQILDPCQPQYMHYIFDGDNLRAYDTDTEIIWLAYKHGFGVATTNLLEFFEDHEMMAENADVIKTERVQEHRDMMYRQGLEWMKKKYGFSNKQEMRMSVMLAMQRFLDVDLKRMKQSVIAWDRK